MKLTVFIPPTVVFATGLIWLGLQTQTISQLHQENHTLTQQIADRNSRSQSTERMELRTATIYPDPNKPIDWKKITEEFPTWVRSQGINQQRAMLRLETRLVSMSAEELIAGLDEVTQCDLAPESRINLELMFIRALFPKDPEYVMNRFITQDQGYTSHLLSTLAPGFKRWAENDPAKAIEWFDQQIAAGTLDSKSMTGENRVRERLEGEIIATLLPSDPEAAAHRLAGLHITQRFSILYDVTSVALAEKYPSAHAEMVRSQVPAEYHGLLFATFAGPILLNGGYAKVTEYLDQIAATPSERARAIDHSVQTLFLTSGQSKTFTSAEIDELRTWADAQAPGSADKTTVAAISALGSYPSQFPNAAELAIHFKETTGNEEILANFLASSTGRSNRELAFPLAEKLNDPKRRESVVKFLNAP